MSVMIAGHNYGRAIPTYPLLEELAERYGISRRAVHCCIHTFLTDLSDLGERPIVNTTYNPNDADTNLWFEITDEAADLIRDSFATYMYTARISTTADAVTGDYCEVVVAKEVGVGRPATRTDLPIRIDNADKLNRVMNAADRALGAAGWLRVTAWEHKPDGIYAAVIHD